MNIKIALVGCGVVSKKHFLSFFRLKKFLHIKAICDVDRDRLKKTSKFLSDLYLDSSEDIKDLIIFDDYLHLLKEIELKRILIDLIVVCTPNGIHANQSIMAGKLGVNVCTEKPLATNYNDLLLLSKVFKGNKAKLFVVLQQRVNPYIQILKKQIDSGRFGKIALITSNLFWQRDQSYYDEARWRGTKHFDGGLLLNQGCHFLDLMSFLPNEKIDKISCFTSTLDRRIEIDNSAILNIKYANGILGSFSSTLVNYPSNLESSISILGSLGSVKIGGKSLNRIENWYFSDKNEDDIFIKKPNIQIDEFLNLSHLYFYKELLEIINNKKTNIFSLSQGLLSCNLAIKAYKDSF